MAPSFIEPLDRKPQLQCALSCPEPQPQKSPYRFFTGMVIYQSSELQKEDAWLDNKTGLTITEIKDAQLKLDGFFVLHEDYFRGLFKGPTDLI